MTDTLATQARDLVDSWRTDERVAPLVLGHDADWMVEDIATWARRLVAESRAGALREAKTATVNASSYDAALEAICRLAAEAEPGAQTKENES